MALGTSVTMSKPDDALKYLICLAVARDPWQHGECGKLFYKNCVSKHGKEKRCLETATVPGGYKE